MTTTPPWLISSTNDDHYIVSSPRGETSFCVSRNTLFSLGLAFVKVAMHGLAPNHFYSLSAETVDIETALNGQSANESSNQWPVNLRSIDGQ